MKKLIEIPTVKSETLKLPASIEEVREWLKKTKKGNPSDD